jgi:hypothetical protein
METGFPEHNGQRQANISQPQNGNAGFLFFQVLDEIFFDCHSFLKFMSMRDNLPHRA